MTAWSRVTPDDVLRAVAEYDRLGQDDFLSTFGFGTARTYLLTVNGLSYDSKAILGVAYLFATGERIGPHDFNGGRHGAAGVLRDLGFDVTEVEQAQEATPARRRSSTFRVSDGMPVTFDDAKAAWAGEARTCLLTTALAYHAVTTYKDLAEQVQERAGIRTSALMMHWIGGVLGLVAADCARRGEPLLTALCVNQAGSVGEGYGLAVLAARGIAPADNDDHAAEERLACYRHFGAALPADGGKPTLTPKIRARRDRIVAEQSQRRRQPCPRCFMELPVSGVCSNCAE